MFKKPLSNFKTSAPLRSSDRRKLKARIIQTFSLPSDDEVRDGEPCVGDLLVPEGIRSAKFSTHLDEPGVVYLAQDGDPLWFTSGRAKDEDELIPTVYTLWKRPTLLPSLSTPSAVIPVLIGGADLMIPGGQNIPHSFQTLPVVDAVYPKQVITSPHSLQPKQLVSVVQCSQSSSTSPSPPLAVGRMAVQSDTIWEDGKKGKAVHILHTWKDCLWELGRGGEPHKFESEGVDIEGGVEREGEDPRVTPPPPSEAVEMTPTPEKNLSPQEVTSILRTSLLQAIHSQLSTLPSSSFPISATTFYTTYILPSRPFHPSSQSLATSTPIDIKHCTHKSLSAFLKFSEKEGLLKLKDIKPDGLVITCVFPKHVDVLAHQNYTTLADVERKREKKAEKEEGESKRVKEICVKELWKPHQQSLGLFDATGNSTTALYTQQEIKTIVNAYITSNNLVNPHQRSYINVDALLQSTLKSKSKTDSEELEFLKREDVVKRVLNMMQSWHEVQSVGGDAVIKKGQLMPISVVTKNRLGRHSTFITNFEPYFLTAEFLAEELRRICASATSVSPVTGKTSNVEVMVQGKQINAIVELLVSKGVPKKWIEAVDLGQKKKR